MNFRVFLLALAALLLGAVAARPAFTEDEDAGGPAKPFAGIWHAQHPSWSGNLTLRADGTFGSTKSGGGKWRLTEKEGRRTLTLDWDEWKPEVLEMVNPDYFVGEVRRGVFRLSRLKGEEAAAAAAEPAPPPVAPPAPAVPSVPDFPDPALTARLQDSTWKFKGGKQFTLHADGSTTTSWHDRKGKWRIVGPNKVELGIEWRVTPPVTVTVESNGTQLRWSDGDWGQLAKRVEPEAEAEAEPAK